MSNTVRSAVKAIIRKGDKFLVIKQGVEDFFVWDFPGGKVEYGESPIDTLHREVKEEVNLEIQIERPLGLWWFFNKKDEDQIVCTTFVCTPISEDIDLTQNPTDENILEFRWVTKEEFLTENLAGSNESLHRLIEELDF